MTITTSTPTAIAQRARPERCVVCCSSNVATRPPPGFGVFTRRSSLAIRVEKGKRIATRGRRRPPRGEAQGVRAGVHHVDVVVSSIERSLPFYRELLEPLGYTRVGTITGERGETVWYLGGTGAGAIGLREAGSAGPPVDRYAVGLHHLAVAAASRAAVDERAAWLRARGAELESES